MSTVAEFDQTTKELGDKIAGLTLLQAKQVVSYLKDVHGIEPAAGGAIMMAPGGGGGGAAAPVEEKTEFDVILAAVGDNKINVIKVVRSADQPRPERSQGSRGRRSQAGEDRVAQGRRRQAQGGARSGRSKSRDQVSSQRSSRPGGVPVASHGTGRRGFIVTAFETRGGARRRCCDFQVRSCARARPSPS